MVKRKGMSSVFLRNLRRKHHLGEFRNIKKHEAVRMVKHSRRSRGRFGYSRRRGGGGSPRGLGGIFGNPMVRGAVLGLGAVVLTNELLSRTGVVKDSGTQNLLKLGAAYLSGGIVGAGAAVVLKQANLSLGTATATTASTVGGIEVI